MKVRVFVLTQQGRDNQDNDTLNVIGVYSTKTKVKEVFEEKQREIIDFYEENYSNEYEEYEEGSGVNWGCSCENCPIYDELLITEKEVDYA